MILGEELGWCGYLQDTLHNITPLQILIRLSISYSVVILLAIIIGYATERTKSLWVAIALHATVDFVALEQPPHWPFITACTLIGWVLLLRTHRQKITHMRHQKVRGTFW